MNAYEFIVKMKDMASSQLRQIASSVGVVKTEVAGVNAGTTALGGGFNKVLSVATALTIAFTALTAAGQLFTKGVELEQTQVKFEVLLGSIKRGTAMFKELNNYANVTPFSNEGIVKAGETMLSFGIQQKDIMKNMSMLGDVAMGNEQKLGSLALVYSQVQATGRLMGQDLLQMINTGFNPLEIISKKTGLSMGILKNKMEDGAISAAMVEEAFRLATSEGGRYHGMTERMAETAGGKWSTLMGTLSNAVAVIGLHFANLVSPLIDVGIAFAENILPFINGLASLFNWIMACTPLLITLGGVAVAVGVQFLYLNAQAIASAVSFGIMNGIAWLATAAMGALEIATAAVNFVMSMNPISLVILAIGALIAIVVALWNKFDWLRGGVMGIWEVIKGFGQAIKDYVINRFKDLLSGITGIGSALVAFFNGDFKEAWEVGKKAAGDLLGINAGKKLFDDGVAAAKTFGEGYKKGVAMVDSPEQKKAAVIGEKKPPVMPGASSVFDELKDGSKSKDKSKSTSSKTDGIVSGGSKMTHITINIQKLQDQTVIHVDSTVKGVQKLGEEVQEMLLRAVNSINQMQTT